ncbi:MAG: aminotransferase [Phenylobacterium zucineum]|nr:MAG: aminotransferase [Phenylobacterium zucineum]
MVHSVYAHMPITVFEEMSGLASRLGAVNLGQGFPDGPGPLALRQKAADAVLNGYNQYPPMVGLPELRQAVADHYRRTQGLDFDGASEVTITSGATEALAAAFLALVKPGDEVVVFQPVYDAYLPLIRRAGGVPKLVTLQPPHWRFDRTMLEAVFSDRTRLVVLNNPINPAGVVLPREDLDLLAEFCITYDAVAICDEVWEQVVFDGAVHTPLIALPGMRARTVKIGSAGKMFGLTGWKVGFLCASPALTHGLSRAHQFLTFTTPPNLQTAVAFGLNEPGDWFTTMHRALQDSRDRLSAGLIRAGFSVLPSQGTYFLNVDLMASGIVEGDRDFALRAVKDAGIAAIPVSALYEVDPVTHILRLCFSKADSTLDLGIERLARARDLSRAAAQI